MKTKQMFLLARLFTLFFIASLILYWRLVPADTARLQTGPGPSLVFLNGRQLIVSKRNPDGTLAPFEPYVIKGVNWSPASTTTNT